MIIVRKSQYLFSRLKIQPFFIFCLMVLLVIAPSMGTAYDSYTERRKKECAQESMRNDVRYLEFLAGMARLENFDEEKGNRIAESLYKKALSISPRDLSLLDNLGRLYAQQKRYQESLDLIDRYIALQPSNLEAIMYRCMLWERMKYPTRDYMNCYKIVLQGYIKCKETSSLNYIFAMIMADEPGADKLKHDYIDGLKPGSPQRRLWEDLLRNADRKKLLDEIIP